jgi:probable F420-dependent oxidoreductase
MTRVGTPIRFGLIASASTPQAVVETAREAEQAGFATVALNDHFNSSVAPLLGLQAMSAATSRIRLSTAALNQGLRHPAVLAKELATLDVLSGGRLEVGLGAGMGARRLRPIRHRLRSGSGTNRTPRREHRNTEKTVRRRTCNFAGRHYTVCGLDGTPKPLPPAGPPILIGGGGQKILSMAARQTDIIRVLGASLGTDGAVVDDLSSFRVEAFEQSLVWIAESAGTRMSDIELSLMLVYVAITDDIEKTAKGFLDFLSSTVARYGGEVGNVDVKVAALLDSPVIAIGTLDQVCEKLTKVRNTLGFSYFVMPYGSTPRALAPIIERISGA